MEFFWETAKNAAKNAWDQYNYSRSLQENLHVLKNEMRELSSREADIKNELNIAKILYGKKPKEEVNLWLENVEKIISEVTKIEEDSRQVRRYYLLSHLALGKLVIKKIEEVVKLKEKSQFSEGLLAYLLPESGSMPTAKLMGGMTAERNLERIWESVTDHDVRTIGVYGMGGVGKTTIMTHVYNRIIKSSIIFGIAIWVTVSNNFNIERLQNDIARGIGLKFSNEEDEMRKSMKLFEALKRMKKFVIILDDVWRPFPLEKVGIPEGSAYKIILTTRSKNMCRGMKCHKKFEVEVLPKEEAWELFKEKLGVDVVLSSEVEHIAKLITEECGGLPLGIITVASAMREKDDVREWRNALEELKCSTTEIEGMDDQVFPILKFSYERFKSERIQSCFLFCALLPEDYSFSAEEMVKYWIAGGLIDDMRDWEKEQDKGQTILNGLIDVCMLVKRSDNQVVMHDLIRDLAIGIIRKNPWFVVKAGMGIRESTGLKEFTEDVEKISLMRHEIDMLSGEPNCPKLSTLLLRENPLSGNISHGFFNHMNSLRVLDLSFTEIEYLPVSVSNLESLCALILKFCRRLREVPSLAKLKHLRVLNLSNTGIKEVPDGMECLVNLKKLHVSSTAAGTNRMNAVGCNSLVLPDSILKLNMHGCDLSSLRCLSRLQCLQTFSISWCGMKWLLPVGDGNTIMALPSIQSLFLEELPSFRDLCEGVLLPGSFTRLKFLRVSRCHVLENLMSLELFQHLQCLELIDIAECSEMEEVIQGEVMVEEGDNNNSNNNTIVLPKLRWLYLCHLGKLRSICKRVIICPSLIKICIEHCCRLKKIPLSLGHSTSVVEGNIKGSKEWWDALEWDDPNTRTLLLPAFEEEEDEDDDEEEEEEDADEEEEEEEEEERGHEGRGLKRKAEQELQHVGSTSRQRGSPH